MVPWCDEDWRGRDAFAHGADTREPLPLPQGIACHAIAGSLSKAAPRGGHPRGDGLVPVASALGRHADPRRALAFEPQQTSIAYGTDHLDLLASGEVYRQIQHWLRGRALTAPQGRRASGGWDSAVRVKVPSSYTWQTRFSSRAAPATSARTSSSNWRGRATRQSSPTISPTARRPSCRAIEVLAGRVVPCVEADVRDVPALRRIFHDSPISAVIHCAGLKAVGESEARPLAYYNVNVGGALALAEVMGEAGVSTLVFSSSATVYGQPERLPVAEDASVAPSSVYGRTKLVVEDFLRDLAHAKPTWRIAILRYFNPAGAHPSGRIGEAPLGRPNNLVPLLCRIAGGEFSELSIFGNDWPTADGTGVRDYLHVQDLAAGHVAAIKYLARTPGVATFNLGVGRGHSVLEVVAAFERAGGRTISRKFAPRRTGDIGCVFADPSRAHELLGWRAARGLDAICADAWRWQVNGGKY